MRGTIFRASHPDDGKSVEEEVVPPVETEVPAEEPACTCTCETETCTEESDDTPQE